MSKSILKKRNSLEINIETKKAKKTRKNPPLPKVFYTSDQKKQIAALYIEYGENIKDEIHEACLIDPILRKKYFEYFIKCAKKREVYDKLGYYNKKKEKIADFDMNSKQICKKTHKEFYVFCFEITKSSFSGLYGCSKLSRLVNEKVRGCWQRSFKRYEKGTIKKQVFEVTELEVLRLLKSQGWKCARNERIIHGTPNIEGYWTIDRIDNSEDYTLANIRIIHSNYQFAYGYDLEDTTCLYPENGIKVAIPYTPEYIIEQIEIVPGIQDCGVLRQCTWCYQWKIRNSCNFTHKRSIRKEKLGMLGQCKSCVINRKGMKRTIDNGRYRVCNGCGEEKIRDTYFYTSTRDKKFGRRSTCMDCMKCTNPREVIQCLLKHCRESDGTGVDTLNIKDVIYLLRKQGFRCIITKIPLEFCLGTPFKISIDRVNPNLPHTVDNCQLVCAVMNVRSKGRNVYNNIERFDKI